MITQRTKSTHETKQRIVDAALKLFVDQGVDATTTRHIAAAAKIAEGTIYRHFESKDALAKELFEGEFVPFSKALQQIVEGEGTTIERIALTVRHFYRCFDAEPAKWAYIMTFQGGAWSRVPADVMTPVRLMTDVLSQGNARKEIKVKDVPFMTQLLLGLIEHPALGVIYEEIEGPLSGREKEVMQAIEKLLTH
ncbi:MAG: TetR/AcrR family transcriptional regulator [Parvibaculum sp.]